MAVPPIPPTPVNRQTVAGAGGALTSVQKLKRLAVKSAIRQLMPVAPTVTTYTTAAWTTGSPAPSTVYTKLWPSDNTATANWDPIAKFVGGFPARGTNRILPRVATANPATATSPTVVTGFNDVISGVGFMTDAPIMAFFLNTSNTLPFRFRVNGLLASLAGTVAAATGDSYMVLDLTGSSVTYPAFIEIEGPNSWGIQRILTAPIYTTWAPRSDKPRIMVCGDSYVAAPLGSQYTSPTPINQDGWVKVMGDYLDVADVWASGLGGTGWVTANGAAPAFRDRPYDALNLMPDGVTPRSSWTPDLIILTFGLNDVAGGQTTSSVQAALQSAYAYIRARNATVPILIAGVHWRAIGNLANTQAMEAAIRSTVATLALSDALIGFLPISEIPATQWVAGTGYQGAANASGNSDTRIGTDGVHWSFAGHVAGGQQYALGVVNFAATLPG